MLVQTTPTFGDIKHGGATAVAQNRPADEDGGSQRGRPLEARLAALLRSAGVLVKAQQIVGEANAQERAFGGVEVLHAEAVGLEIVFEFLDVLLTAGALVVVAPEVGPIALAIGDKNPEGVAIHVDEPTPNSAFVFTDALADGEKFARSRPTLEFQREARPSVVFIDGCPRGESGGLALHCLGQTGNDDVGDPARFEESKQGVFEKSRVGPHGAQLPVGGHQGERFRQECRSATMRAGRAELPPGKR